MALIQDSKFCMRTDGRADGRPAGRVSENNATGGPNSSAKTELSWSVGAVYGKKQKQPKLNQEKSGEVPSWGSLKLRGGLLVFLISRGYCIYQMCLWEELFFRSGVCLIPLNSGPSYG